MHSQVLHSLGVSVFINSTIYCSPSPTDRKADIYTDSELLISRKKESIFTNQSLSNFCVIESEQYLRPLVSWY